MQKILIALMLLTLTGCTQVDHSQSQKVDIAKLSLDEARVALYVCLKDDYLACKDAIESKVEIAH